MIPLLCLPLVAVLFCACTAGSPPADADTASPGATPSGQWEESSSQEEESLEDAMLKITVGEHELLARFADNGAAEEFCKLLSQGPITVEMEDYGGFEKVGPLGTTLSREDSLITTEPGDVILYQGDHITIYYGSNTWNFTRLARIEDPADLREKLGEGTVSITFSLA